MHDNSVGETVLGSTGNPSTNYCGRGLYLTADGSSITNARFSFLDTALKMEGEGFVQNGGNLQFVKCRIGLDLVTGDLGVTLNLENSLLYSISNVVAATDGQASSLNFAHITAHDCNVFNSLKEAFISITNSLFVGVTSFSTVPLSGVVSNQLVYLDDGAEVFQTVGAGGHYLIENSPYRNAGTTNIGTNLLAGLRTKTTYPPIVYSNVTLLADLTLSPQIERDSNLPDLGYHYEPIDLISSNCFVAQNVTLILSNGIVVCPVGTGIVISNNANFISTGEPAQHNRVANYHSVQEGSDNWPTPGISFGSQGEVRLEFTDLFLGLGRVASVMNGTPSSVLVQDCWLHDAIAIFSPDNASISPQILWKNNVIERSWLLLADLQEDAEIYGMYVQLINNLFVRLNGSLYLDHSGQLEGGQWIVYNNMFDSAPVIDISAYPISYANNAYTTNFNFQIGPLGKYYQATNSPYLNAGASPATYWALYHYTTQTNQIKETNSVVDIGFHYVAVDTNGAPIDTDGDGYPDYREDGNGNGSVNSGETDWNSASDLGLRVLITRPAKTSFVP